MSSAISGEFVSGETARGSASWGSASCAARGCATATETPLMDFLTLPGYEQLA